MIFLYSFIALLLPSVVLGAESGGTYELMAPLGPLSGKVGLTGYLEGVVQVAIGLSGLLAVIMIVICGIKLMGTPSASAKSEAKECVTNAIFGLLLAVSAWVILYTINPLLISREVDLASINTTAPAGQTGPIIQPRPKTPGWYFQVTETSTGSSRYISAGRPTSGSDVCNAILAKAKQEGGSQFTVSEEGCFLIPDTTRLPPPGEKNARITLCGETEYNKNQCVGPQKAPNVAINRLPCKDAANSAQERCTNVDGIGDALTLAQALQAKVGCCVVITGGSETYPHKSHGMRPVIDLDKTVSLNKLLLKEGTGKRSSWMAYRIYYDGFWFTDEGNHWHVCKAGLSDWYCNNYTDKTRTKQVPETTALMN